MRQWMQVASRARRSLVRVAGALGMWGLGLGLTPTRALGVQAVPDNVPTTPPPPPPGASPALDSARAERGRDLEIAVYTYGPGSEVFERFGHIALAITDRARGQDIAFNWGMFDFNQPNFLWRFLTGDTRYWMEGYDTFAFNALYQSQDRSIRRQRLQLTPMQRGAIADYVWWNADERNRYYRYDYYNDNCSTRIRDVVDWALGGALKAALDTMRTEYTWRDETARITADNLPVYAGIQVALGQPADRDLSAWQTGFLPERLATSLAAYTLADGTRLVAHDTVLYAAQRAPLAEGPPSRAYVALGLGVVLAGLLALLSRIPALHAVLTGVGTVWYLVAGVVGTALLLAGTVTKHAPYMGSNLTLFQVQPLLLLTAALWWARGRPSRAGRAATWAAVISGTLALVGVVLWHIPGLFHQHNDVVWMFTAPIHLALAFAALPRRARAGART